MNQIMVAQYVFSSTTRNSKAKLPSKQLDQALRKLTFGHSIRELYAFHNTSSPVSQAYQESLEFLLNNGIRVLLAASLNDHVVSWLATAWT